MNKYLIAAAVAAVMLTGCEDKAEVEAARAAVAQREARVESYIKAGPKVFSTTNLPDGTLRVLHVPKQGIGSSFAELQTCLLFTHTSGSSSLSCDSQGTMLLDRDIPTGE